MFRRIHLLFTQRWYGSICEGNSSTNTRIQDQSSSVQWQQSRVLSTWIFFFLFSLLSQSFYFWNIIEINVSFWFLFPWESTKIDTGVWIRLRLHVGILIYQKGNYISEFLYTFCRKPNFWSLWCRKINTKRKKRIVVWNSIEFPLSIISVWIYWAYYASVNVKDIVKR